MKVFVACTHDDQSLADTLSMSLKARGDEPVRAAELDSPAPVVEAISAAIRSADLLVAILSSASPNIYYELGLARGSGVPLVVAARDTEHVPFDLLSTRFVHLGGDDTTDAQLIVRTVALMPVERRRTALVGSARDQLKSLVEDPGQLESVSPPAFDRLVSEALREAGCQVRRPAIGEDIGVDLVIEPKNQEPVLIEVKKLNGSGRVSVEAVAQLARALENSGTRRGLLISSAGFSSASLRFASQTGIRLATLREFVSAPSIESLLSTDVGRRVADQTGRDERSRLAMTLAGGHLAPGTLDEYAQRMVVDGAIAAARAYPEVATDLLDCRLHNEQLVTLIEDVTKHARSGLHNTQQSLWGLSFPLPHLGSLVLLAASSNDPIRRVDYAEDQTPGGHWIRRQADLQADGQTYEVRVQVVAPSGAPAHGVTVELALASEDVVRSGLTDANGVMLFLDVAAVDLDRSTFRLRP